MTTWNLDDDYFELALFADDLDVKYYQLRESLSDVNAYNDERFYLDDDNIHVLGEDDVIVNFWDLQIDAMVRKQFYDEAGLDNIDLDD